MAQGGLNATSNGFRRLAALAPHDTNTLGPCRAVFVGGAGNLVVEMRTNPGVYTTIPVAAGTTIPIVPWRVRAATTATGLLRLW